MAQAVIRSVTSAAWRRTLAVMKSLLPAFTIVLLVSCAHGSPPSAFERSIYDIRTQLVEVVVMQTNFVIQGTNGTYHYRPVTNYAETYERIPKESVVTGIQTGGAIATTFGFGLGGIIATLVLGAYGAWATWSNQRKAKLNKTLGQNIETSFETIKLVTKGTVVSDKLQEEIKAQQVDAGVKEMAKEIVDAHVNTVKARESAERVVQA